MFLLGLIIYEELINDIHQISSLLSPCSRLIELMNHESLIIVPDIISYSFIP